MNAQRPRRSGAERSGQDGPQSSPDRCDSMGTLPMFTAYETSGAVRKSDPAPSAEAARSVDVRGQRGVILDYLQNHLLVTADDLQEVTGTHRSSWSSRLAGMHRDGLVTHDRPVVKTTGARRQTVTSFTLTAAGRELLAGLDGHRDHVVDGAGGGAR